jgi:hypothetical protein
MIKRSFTRVLGITVLTVLSIIAVHRKAEAIPAFARQTAQPCSACHIGAFGPQLTPFGIAFKMAGYTLAAPDTPWPFVPLSVMVLQSFTNTASPVQNIVAPTYARDNNYNLDQISYFLAGRITDNAGGLVQITTSDKGSSTALDDSDVRLTKLFTIVGNDVRGGLSLNDGPTVQDPYNTLYHYSYPYASSDLAPTPSTAQLAISAMAANTLGLTTYWWINQTWYLDVGGYKSLRTTWLNALGEANSIGFIDGVAPYVRLAWQKLWGNNFLELGGLFFYAEAATTDGFGPGGINDFADYGIDANYQYTNGDHTFAVATNFIQQSADLRGAYDAGAAGKASNFLSQYRIAADYYFQNTYGFTIAYNDTWGSRDSILYAAAPIVGSASGTPNYKALTFELDWVPFGKSAATGWDFEKNIKVGLQYTHYLEFNGGTKNFDGFGHNASGMDTLYLYVWLIF